LGGEKFPLKKMDDFEEPLNRSIFALRPFQPKNPRGKTKISARCARRPEKEREKNKRKSFLILVSSDQKPQMGGFTQNSHANKARGKFLGCFVRAKRACWRKVLEICALNPLPTAGIKKQRRAAVAF